MNKHNVGFMEIAVENLVKAPWNYKVEDVSLSKKLELNIKRNGQIENIIVRQIGENTFEVVNGNHRLDTFINLGMKKVYCYNLGSISEPLAKRIAVETNETKFSNNIIELSEVMSDIIKEFSVDDLLETFPYTENELEDILNVKDFDFTQYDSMPDEDTEITENKRKKEVVCPSCGHTWSE